MKCMYVWMAVLPVQAEGKGPSLHTYMDPCRFEERRFFHVCLLLPMQAEGKRILGAPHSEMANGVDVCMYVCMYVSPYPPTPPYP